MPRYRGQKLSIKLGKIFQIVSIDTIHPWLLLNLILSFEFITLYYTQLIINC